MLKNSSLDWVIFLSCLQIRLALDFLHVFWVLMRNKLNQHTFMKMNWIFLRKKRLECVLFPKDINYPRIGKWAQFCNSFGHINSHILSWLGSDLFCDISISIFKRTFWYDFLCNFARNGSWKNINIQASLIHFWFLLFTLQQVTTERGIDISTIINWKKKLWYAISLSSLIPLIALFTVDADHQKKSHLALNSLS